MTAYVSKSIGRGINLVCRRSLHISSANLDKYTMPDPIDHATGLEKAELMAIAAGNEDPFNMKVVKRTSGELNNPTLVPSYMQSRIVGCICHEDATSINWMWLYKGEPKRCECGYYFKLIDKE